MKIAGIIAEYNPFHNGHAWHVAETRRQTGCDWVVACIAGHFTQRGEPAVMSKWARTRMALVCGVDAVFELPALFAVRTADAFARGGVGLLGGIGVDALSFGCETDDLDRLGQLAELRANEPASVSARIGEKLDEGMSLPRARGEACAEYLGLPPEQLNQPNMILATEYLCAMRSMGFTMSPVAIRRRGAYHDLETGRFASAAAIREALFRGERAEAMRCIPEAARTHASWEALHAMDDILMYRLREMSHEALHQLPDVSEGLDQRVFRLCRETSGRDELIRALKCKRYTHARLSRLMAHALIGMTRHLAEAHPRPAWARLIGLRRGAEPLMRILQERAALPIIASPTLLREDAVFQLECRATDVWALLHDNSDLRLPGREYIEPFVRI